MLAVRIADTRDFMKKLLTQDLFDTFLFSEGSVTTFTTFTIDGTWHPDYFEDQKVDALTWGLMRPVFFGLIKGKHIPVSFRIVLRLSDSNTESLLASSGLSMDASQIAGLFLNLNYQNNTVTCTTGTSLKIFTLDKTLDRVWDDMVMKFFSSRKIQAEIL